MAEEIKDENKQTEEPTIEQLKADLAKAKSDMDKLKQATTNASADASAWKKKYQATLSEQERKDAETAEQRQAEQAELEALRKEKRAFGLMGHFGKMGYDNETSGNLASLFAEGKEDDFFAALETADAAKAKKQEADLLKGQPGLSSGKAPTGKDAEAAEQAQLRKWFGL